MNSLESKNIYRTCAAKRQIPKEYITVSSRKLRSRFLLFVAKTRATKRGVVTQIAPGPQATKGPHSTQCFKVCGPHKVSQQ